MTVLATPPDAMAPARLDVPPSGIAWLVLDAPDQKVNLLSAAMLDRIEELLREAKSRSDVKALAVASGKPGTFIAGADVAEIGAIRTPEEGRAKAARGQAILGGFAGLGKPTLAAIDGACLGGGLELALACTFRLASDGRHTRLGLPEVRLGIIPGFGGTQRLPKLVGLPNALDLILTGRTIDAGRALRIGLVDAVVPGPYLRAQAEAWLRNAVEKASKGRYGRLARRRRPRRLHRLLSSRLIRRLVLHAARNRLIRSVNGVYPAPFVALRAVRSGLRKDLRHGLEQEASYVGGLLTSHTCKSLTWLFTATGDARREGRLVDPATGRPAVGWLVNRAGVLGAGVMGGGIAHLLARQGIPVRMKDLSAELLIRGMKTAADLVEKEVARRRIDRREAAARMTRIAPALTYEGFRSLNLVIEAVVEDLGVKQAVLGEVEGAAGEDCVFATNTSSLPIREIASRARRPERVAGMHFFNPVHLMPLVEIIPGPSTSPETLATVHDLARRLGKTPIVVTDTPGFLVNRVLTAYLAEALKMLVEGTDPATIERAMEHFGMPMGPFALFDQVGFDTASRASRAIEALNERYLPRVSVMSTLVQAGRLGVKNGRGFYRYRKGRRAGFDRHVLSLLDRHGTPETDAESIQKRLYLPMVNEAVRCLNAGVARRPADVDLGLVLGTGFPPFRGGPLRNADVIGIAAVVEGLNRLAEKHGERLAPDPSLVEMALGGRRFYPD